jgi:hypothetical protein
MLKTINWELELVTPGHLLNNLTDFIHQLNPSQQVKVQSAGEGPC